MKIRKPLLLASLLVLGACSQPRGIKQGDVQVVAQWLLVETPGPKSRTAAAIEAVGSAIERMTWEWRVDANCDTLCFLDGDDFGSGTYNLYLYTQNVAGTIRMLVDLEHANKLPAGLRIGVWTRTSPSQTNWTYRAVYPHSLKLFDVQYGSK